MKEMPGNGKRIRERDRGRDNYSGMSSYLEAKSSIESEDSWMASIEEKAGDLSTLEKIVP